MSEQWRATPRIRSDHLRTLLDEIETWLKAGDLEQPAWFNVPHDRAGSDWLIRIDATLPIPRTRVDNPNREIPVDMQTLYDRDLPTDTTVPVEIPVGPARAEMVQAALAGLHPKEREVAELVLVQGMSMAEVAAELGLSRTTIWRRVESAKSHLVAELGVLYRD
jgi:RNA polymerase sigma factor (sigma-70 family)